MACESIQCSPIVMGQISPQGLVMAKRQAAPRTCAIWGEMWPYAIWNKIGTTKGIHLLNLQGGNNLESVQKPSQKDHMLINATCVGTNLKESKESSKFWSGL